MIKIDLTDLELEMIAQRHANLYADGWQSDKNVMNIHLKKNDSSGMLFKTWTITERDEEEKKMGSGDVMLAKIYHLNS